jgi:hypothetical protein
MNMLHQTRLEAQEIVVAEPVAGTPANSLGDGRGGSTPWLSANRNRDAAALGELIKRGNAEILDPPRLVRRNARKVVRYAGV